MKIVVLDTETCGFEEGSRQLVELSAVCEGEIVFNMLANPGVPIPPQASAVHHLTDDDVASAPPAADVVGYFAEKLMDLAEDRDWHDEILLVAHNAEYDKGILTDYMSDFGEMHWLCTYRCASHLWPDSPGHSNQVMRYWLKLQPDVNPTLHAHRALYDVRVTASLLDAMLRGYTVSQLVEMQSKPILQTVCRFGKHRGTRWDEVPTDYLRWMQRQDFDPDTAHTVQTQLASRARPR